MSNSFNNQFFLLVVLYRCKVDVVIHIFLTVGLRKMHLLAHTF